MMRDPTWREPGPAPGELDYPAQRVLREVEASGALPEGVDAAETVSAVLCALGQRLSGGEADDLMEALPDGLKALMRPCAAQRWRPGETFGRDELLRRIADHLGIEPPQAEPLARIVFAAVHPRIGAKEVQDVEEQLPRDLKELWRARPPG